jgi:peptide deformylase
MSETHGEVREPVEEGEEPDAQAQLRRRIALAQIRQWGDPALRLPARPVESFDESLLGLVGRMRILMREANGVGLAATQIGVLQSLFVFQRGEEGEEASAVVNPRISERSDEVATDDEGCLSLQGVLVPVERHVGVTLEGQDETGADVRLELTDLEARVVQHEVDHLDGVLILDRTDPESRRQAMAALRRPPGR